MAGADAAGVRQRRRGAGEVLDRQVAGAGHSQGAIDRRLFVGNFLHSIGRDTGRRERPRENPRLHFRHRPRRVHDLRAPRPEDVAVAVPGTRGPVDVRHDGATGLDAGVQHRVRGVEHEHQGGRRERLSLGVGERVERVLVRGVAHDLGREVPPIRDEDLRRAVAVRRERAKRGDEVGAFGGVVQRVAVQVTRAIRGRWTVRERARVETPRTQGGGERADVVRATRPVLVLEHDQFHGRPSWCARMRSFTRFVKAASVATSAVWNPWKR